MHRPHSLDGFLPVNRVAGARSRGAWIILFDRFSSVPASALARQLARWVPAPVDGRRQDIAQRLGQWLNVKEAIALHAVSGAVEATGVAAARRKPSTVPRHALHDNLLDQLRRAQSVLAQSIRRRDPTHRPDPEDPDTEFAFYHQRLNEQQRRMELAVDALRSHVRQTLAQSSPDHARLAALDAHMQALFGGRERRILAQLPALLKARFAALRQAAITSDLPHDPRWLQVFADEFEQVLLAELDLRLQPVMGLIESLEHDD
jgi:Protein of unknown function (DUF3348)